MLSAGIRVGWVTGHQELINRISLHSQTTSLHTSGISQAIVLTLLESWGIQGFLNHVDGVSKVILLLESFLLC